MADVSSDEDEQPETEVPGSVRRPQPPAPARNRVLPTADSIKSIGGLIAVIFSVIAVTTLAIVTMAYVHKGGDADTLVPLATAAFGVISATTGAYLGIKIGTDQTRTLAEDASRAHATAALAQSFVPAEQQEKLQERLQETFRDTPGGSRR